MSPRERRLRTRSLSLRALEWEGEGAPLVAVHATSFCAEVWAPVRAAASPRRPWIALDQRGHGRSDVPEDPAAYAWTRVAEDVGDVLRSLRAEAPGRMALVGHSSGATAALVAAAAVPEAVESVLLVEPVLFDPVPPGADADSFAGSRVLTARSGRRRARFQSREAAHTALRGRFPYSGFDDAAFDAYLDGGFEVASDGSLSLRCRPEVEAWAYQGAAALDLWKSLDRLRAPVHLVVAEHSAVPLFLRERLQQAAPGGPVLVVSATTHFAPLERPAEVGRAIAARADSG